MKLYIPPPESKICANIANHMIPFRIEDHLWQYVSDPADADIIPVMIWSTVDEIINELAPIYTGQTLAILNLFHMGDNQDFELNTDMLAKQFSTLTDRVTVVHQNQKNLNPKHVYYDIMWNLEKAYFVDNMFQKYPVGTWLWYSTERSYALNEILSNKINCVNYLSPTRFYKEYAEEPRMIARRMLLDILKDYQGYYPNESNGYFLKPEDCNPSIDSVHVNKGSSCWLPAANHYYETSYVSIYVESVTTGELAGCITEKTYDPLIKGHFILPFGYSGLVKDIHARGFQLPNWIDYSYDYIADWQTRLDAWLSEAKRICEMESQFLTQCWISDFNIIKHNRELFTTRGYHELHGQLRTQRERHAQT